MMKDIRANFDSAAYQAFAKESVVLSLLKLDLKDEVILSKTAELLKQKKFTKANSITNLLYALAKFKYVHADTVWIASAIESIMNEPKIDLYLSCRNLWNLYALDYKSEAALEKFSLCIQEADGSKLNELDIANALRAFAHF